MTVSDIAKEEIFKLIGQGRTILNIGAYNGKDAVELADVCKTEVHCFEPTPDSYEILKELKDERLILWPYAIGCISGFTYLTISPNHPQSNSLKAPHRHKRIFNKVKFKNDKVRVNVTTLDEWHWSVLKGSVIDFIWCDANGGEVDVILGGTKALAKTRYIYMEFCETALYRDALDRKGLKRALPGFETISEHNFSGNYGSLLMKNKNL